MFLPLFYPLTSCSYSLPLGVWQETKDIMSCLLFRSAQHHAEQHRACSPGQGNPSVSAAQTRSIHASIKTASGRQQKGQGFTHVSRTVTCPIGMSYSIPQPPLLCLSRRRYARALRCEGRIHPALLNTHERSPWA